jgi:hypothetical protein
MRIGLTIHSAIIMTGNLISNHHPPNPCGFEGGNGAFGGVNFLASKDD